MLLSLDRLNEDEDGEVQATTGKEATANDEEHEQTMMDSASDATALSETDSRL